jgi:hypothetical protein
MLSPFANKMAVFGLFSKLSSEVLLNLVLFARFRFPVWHIFATTKNRLYKTIAYQMAANLEVDQYIEIGAGLGDISYRLKNSLLLDNDERVLRAARIKHSQVRYELFDFKDSNFDILNMNNYDRLCLIAVNVVQPNEWNNFLEKLELYVGELYVIADVISDNCPDPMNYPWIPERIAEKNYFCLYKTYADDSVRDIILMKRIYKA